MTFIYIEPLVVFDLKRVFTLTNQLSGITFFAFVVLKYWLLFHLYVCETAERGPNIQNLSAFTCTHSESVLKHYF